MSPAGDRGRYRWWGILHPRASSFEVDGFPPSDDVTRFVDHYWRARWELDRGEEFSGIAVMIWASSAVRRWPTMNADMAVPAHLEELVGAARGVTRNDHFDCWEMRDSWKRASPSTVTRSAAAPIEGSGEDTRRRRYWRSPRSAAVVDRMPVSRASDRWPPKNPPTVAATPPVSPNPTPMVWRSRRRATNDELYSAQAVLLMRRSPPAGTTG